MVTRFEDNVDFSDFSIFIFKGNHVFIEKKHDPSERAVRLRLVFVDEECENLKAVIDQGNFIFQMEWAPFKRLFWNTNDSTVNLKISLWDRPCYENMLIYDSDEKCRKLTIMKN